VESAVPEDRRTRFARVTLTTPDDDIPISLVTDARGRMRHRLPDGEYHVLLPGGEHVRFTVRDQRWTTVRIHLP
jgi:hypothetical protein